MTPDWKPAPRIVDAAAVKAARLTNRTCAACGGPAWSIHHVIPRSERGDDVPGNLVGLCGSGTSLCHGAWHGNPYWAPWTAHTAGQLGGYQRRDAEWVARRIGQTIAKTRPDVIAYVKQKLGAEAGADYLARRYYL